MQISNGNLKEIKPALQFPAARSNAPGSHTRTPGAGSPASLADEIEAVRSLLDQGLSSEAEKRSRSLIKTARRDASTLAKAHCFLSVALEMQGRYRESLEVVRVYELTDSHGSLDTEALALVRVHVGLAYNYTGDHPKAIAILNTALRESSQSGSAAQLGAIYVALARVYRSINEYNIARDHALSALEHYRRTGGWRGLAESYFGIALAELFEGKYEVAVDNFNQALKLAGDNPAPYLLGKIHTNMAGAFWFLKRTQEGISCLEKAIGYYERTEHKANAADGYNNLGMNLILVGDWDRAQEALDRALLLASEIDEQDAKVPMVLDSLGQLKMLRGEFAEAQGLLQRAVSLATEHGNKWYARQALCTLGRCRLAMNDANHAIDYGLEGLGLAEGIGDRQAVCESRLLLAEAYLRSDQLDKSIELVQQVSAEVTDSAADVGMIGEAERLHGLIATVQNDSTRAAQHFGRSLSIFEMLGDRYRSALASEALGAAYATTNPRRAVEKLAGAVQAFRQLGAKPDLARAEQALAALDREAPERRSDPLALTQLLTLRLADAAASRELLLHELAAVLNQESEAERIMVAEARADGRFDATVSYGFKKDESRRLADELHVLESEKAQQAFDLKYNASVIRLKPQNAAPAMLVIAPRGREALAGGLSIEPLLRVATLGLEVCALRERLPDLPDGREQAARLDQKVLPGFIYSSPAMTRLVEEIHKIRSSNVTVLVTGESGTGKELVARAIHQLSSRRSRVFAPFNCTAVPKELSEAYLFGYKRGSFTGATSDSPGVIRSAAGGTLFLDEIGDLPADLQPKLLRFLQEGEIQPLGEQRPLKVDVRIIAATNTDLERLVAEGRFREDLYYRLNVIRLQVPPLRERRSEIPAIVDHYVDHYSEKFGRRDIRITSQTMDLLMVCDWPGNVRQVCNEVQRIVARAEDGTVVTPDQLSPELGRMSAHLSSPPGTATYESSASDNGRALAMSAAVEELERRMIVAALRDQGGNVTRAARQLGITRRGLQLKLVRYAINATA
jgi:transcriptional regulator with GAF, ATPase, and Fis domain/Tfp pilus assembly protein PilF